MSAVTDKPLRSPIRDAASLILLRGPARDPRVLLGRRADSNRFMPGVYVFPGGVLQAGDFTATAAGALDAACIARMGVRGNRAFAEALAKAALRETLEETGVMLGVGDGADIHPRHPRGRPPRHPRVLLSGGGEGHGDGHGAGDGRDSGDGDGHGGGDRDGDNDGDHNELEPGWRLVRATGLRPALGQMTYLGRALTPTGMPMRFNARFFLAPAEAAHGEAAESDELTDLRWLRPRDCRALPLVPITAYILNNFTTIQHRATAGQSFIYRHNGRRAMVAWR